MANNKMLIDATHPEETRVVVLRNGRVEEFDYESAARKQLRGNIYLAKVTRVEPALQAAFVDYGGNRHGFLAFNEIHPDYYQIPVADRQALLDEEAAAEAEEEAAADARAERLARRRSRGRRGRGGNGADAQAAEDGAVDADASAADEHDDTVSDDQDAELGSRVEVVADADDDDGEPAVVEIASLDVAPLADDDADGDADDDDAEVVAAPKRGRRSAKAKAAAADESDVAADGAQAEDTDAADDADEDDDGSPPTSIAEDTGLDNDVISEDAPEPEDEPDGDEPEADVGTGSDDGDAPAAEASEGATAEATTDEPAEAVDADAKADAEETAEVVDEEGNDAPVAEASDSSDADTDEATDDAAPAEPEAVDDIGDETTNADALEELPRPRRRSRTYKIQEVIKRRQVLLIQVVKEERGNKGAALTTYLSLAGRYTVLMPNTARGGGISRKITNPQDRKRLKAIAEELDVPEGMGLIIRTAGAARTKQEIRRDFEYLLRLWESVRDLTLESSAPSLVYEEGDLIKRSIRDLYNKEVDEVVVAGTEGHKEAKDFMRMLMPSHAKNVTLHNEPESLFTKHGIERQLNAMFSPYVTLKSGGYLVINQTEALVAVDVNSGKATREFSIEETAVNTNLEAADEIARQLKLRDLAGLVVIDFIDMEEKRNNRAVERRLKDALKYDRARIQLGRISHFGLMEMSRQRLRTGVLEGSTSQCPACQGTGIIRSTESIALAVLRGIEDALTSGLRHSLVAHMTQSVALYILNNKRAFINEMEARYGVSIVVQASDKLQGANFQIEQRGAAGAPPPIRRNDRSAVNMDWGFDGNSGPAEAEDATARASTADDDDQDGNGGRDGTRRRRRRRGRRGGAGSDGRRADRFEGDEQSDEVAADGTGDQPVMNGADDDVTVQSGDETAAASADGDDSQGGRRRRRGRRGGRRGRERGRGGNAAPDVSGEGADGVIAADDAPTNGAEPVSADAGGDADTGAPAGVAEAVEAHAVNGSAGDANGAAAEPAMAKDVSEPVADVTSQPSSEGDAVSEAVAVHDDEPAAVKRSRAMASVEPAAPKLERVVLSPDVEDADGDAQPASAGPVRRGWWQRRLGSQASDDR